MKTYLILGSNIGDKIYYLNNAVELIEKNIGKIILKSSVYESEPWGFESKSNFINQVICVDTNISPEKILENILLIEKKLDRVRSSIQFTDRTIDIDILFIDDLIIDKENLKIPHPLLHKRKFVLTPLVEIAEDFVHPVFKKTIEKLLEECEDKLKVIKLNIEYRTPNNEF
ncbi:MAG: 2-amino-4-hydroxy-6-hydroxymethyldihydropteridine diphosphokinase [Bacteroidales bacterium]|nr:2-amino-4-hydroxy-6-hydroxymethyldihydropteridine diphosphokinase [Bacteroidales bacterium]